MHVDANPTGKRLRTRARYAGVAWLALTDQRRRLAAVTDSPLAILGVHKTIDRRGQNETGFSNARSMLAGAPRYLSLIKEQTSPGWSRCRCPQTRSRSHLGPRRRTTPPDGSVRRDIKVPRVGLRGGLRGPRDDLLMIRLVRSVRIRTRPSFQGGTKTVSASYDAK